MMTILWGTMSLTVVLCRSMSVIPMRNTITGMFTIPGFLSCVHHRRNANFQVDVSKNKDIVFPIQVHRPQVRGSVDARPAGPPCNPCFGSVSLWCQSRHEFFLTGVAGTLMSDGDWVDMFTLQSRFCLDCAMETFPLHTGLRSWDVHCVADCQSVWAADSQVPPDNPAGVHSSLWLSNMLGHVIPRSRWSVGVGSLWWP
jgi:hypothetical protein